MQLVSRPKKRSALARRQTRSGPGVALIFVLTTVAILTAIAVDFTYNTRVNLELAVQSRDELRARALAMSAMNFSRLLLHFQKQLDDASGAAGQGLGGLMQAAQSVGGGGGLDSLMNMAKSAGVDPSMVQNVMQGAIGGLGAGGAIPSIRLWEALPKNALDSNTVMAGFLAAQPAAGSDAFKKSQETFADARPGPDDSWKPVQATFGDFGGHFSAHITDEDQKINVQRLEYSLGGGPQATFVQLHSMIDSPKYDFIFDEEDANHDQVDRNDVITAIKDYIDADQQQSQLDPTVLNATTALSTSLFTPGFGDENGPYMRYKRPYKAKNAKLDTLEELHMVYGINDAFMAAFKDRLTVWPDVNGKLNINTDDPRQLLVDITTAAANPLDPLLRDPQRLQLIMQQIQLVKRFPFIGLSVPTFVSIVEGNGIQVKPEIKANSAQNVYLGDKSSTFRVVATGEVQSGARTVKKTLTAIVRYDDGMGQLLYWHED